MLHYSGNALSFISLPYAGLLATSQTACYSRIHISDTPILHALDAFPWQPYFHGNGSEPGNFHDVMARIGEDHSPELCELVRDCIRLHSDDRPTWEQIKEKIEYAFDEQGENFAQNTGFDEAVHPEHLEQLHHLPRDAYALGLSMIDLLALKMTELGLPGPGSLVSTSAS